VRVTPWQLALRNAQLPVTDRLKRFGFRKGGNQYNRAVADNLVQVVGFQSGQAVSILHGNFTVNLGIYIPPVAALEGNTAKGRYVTDAHCEIRSRLSQVAGLGGDTWWPLDGSAQATGMLIANALEEHGVPFLDRYSSYADIRRRLDEDGVLPFNNAARSALAVGIICWASGAISAARTYFDHARSTPTNNRHFVAHVDEIQTRCGC
jgi:hypothetical protein